MSAFRDASGRCTICGDVGCAYPGGQACFAAALDDIATPDDLPEPGDRCRHCGRDITWVGPADYDWAHIEWAAP